MLQKSPCLHFFFQYRPSQARGVQRFDTYLHPGLFILPSSTFIPISSMYDYPLILTITFIQPNPGSM